MVRLARCALVTVTAAWLPALGCADDGEGSVERPTVTVVFDYFAPTERDTSVGESHPNCFVAVGHTHFHPSWKSFRLYPFEIVGDDHFQITFDRVPTGSLQRIRVSDPNACVRDPCGASTRNVFANGVELTRVVDTPGGCSFTNTTPADEPGLAFTVLEDGTVTP